MLNYRGSAVALERINLSDASIFFESVLHSGSLVIKGPEEPTLGNLLAVIHELGHLFYEKDKLACSWDEIVDSETCAMLFEFWFASQHLNKDNFSLWLQYTEANDWINIQLALEEISWMLGYKSFVPPFDYLNPLLLMKHGLFSSPGYRTYQNGSIEFWEKSSHSKGFNRVETLEPTFNRVVGIKVSKHSWHSVQESFDTSRNSISVLYEGI